MVSKILKWLREHYFTIVRSIAFYPAIIVVGFLILAVCVHEFDFSKMGRDFKGQADWLNLKDSSTARTIIATVAAGIISLAVFSFSMVMILLNQAATNMSNRILDSMIGNSYHQVILGFYIGTIAYSFFLLSTIRDIDSSLHIPSLSIYFLIILTIVDIFLFIYFLHYITQSVKYETIINRIHESTLNSMREHYSEENDSNTKEHDSIEGTPILADESGYFHGFASRSLVSVCEKKDGVIYFPHPLSTYILKGSTLAIWKGREELEDDEIKSLWSVIDIFDSQNGINKLPFSGCMQLTEVAIKALSPGINDPVTAVLSINALSKLLAFRLTHRHDSSIKDDNDKTRIIVTDHTFNQYFYKCIYPIWDYGKNDRTVQHAMLNVLSQFETLYAEQYNISLCTKLLAEVKSAIKEQNR